MSNKNKWQHSKTGFINLCSIVIKATFVPSKIHNIFVQKCFVNIEFLERFDPVCQGGQSILCGGRISFRCSLAVDLIDVLEKAEDKCVSAF